MYLFNVVVSYVLNAKLFACCSSYVLNPLGRMVLKGLQQVLLLNAVAFT